MVACAACGAELAVDDGFCGDCGAPVDSAAERAGVDPGPLTAPPVLTRPIPPPSPTELRHVSVLFCDLVGFTPLSESKDPEEMRELLSGYFDLARAIIGRYGGVIQKFIGDAVMAVWGARVANEDDAERAVRAGLELLSGVAAYDSQRGVRLEARVGIVTGGAATTETAEEGLVIGDRVNTAARIQSIAPPGQCYVDETTRAASTAAIAYVDRGSHELKGKAEPVRVFEATRVVAAIAGSQRVSVLEAPFTGRDHELRLLKELFHASAERQAARLVLVSGVAGVGKSRLVWEFFKYIDGLVDDTLWHSGRCLSYGEGVSYWALSEMVRSRLQIGEDDPTEVVAERLRTGLERWIPEPDDREFISPRLGQLLGLPASQALAREELFSGWRLFFERLAEHLPVIMVVEDLQWADAGLVDFLDHLLEWSGDHAIFLLVLTRPEGADRKGLVLSRRSLSTLPLDPLSDDVIGQLLDGLAPDLPASARARIVERAEGIPLYAVETVRALLDKDILERGPDGLLHLVGELGTMEIPPGLTALIASRLDALSPDERRVVKECSVLGESFARQSVQAVTEIDPAQLDDILSSLVRKEVLTVRAEKLSPERGQYAFTQSLIRSVAYDTLSRAERKARHLRTAAHLRASFPEQGAEVSEVIAAHLYDAYQASGDDPDAAQLRQEAKDAYVQAGERAESVGALQTAEGAYLRAIELSTDEGECAELTERAGRLALVSGFIDRALERFEAARAAHRAAGRPIEAASTTAWLGYALNLHGQGEDAIIILRDELASLGEGDAPAAVVAHLAIRLGGALLFSGHGEEALQPLQRALVLAQHYELGETLAGALNAYGIALSHASRFEEARLHFEGSLDVAKRYGIKRSEILAEGNLADLCMIRDLPGAEEHCQASLALARLWGNRDGEANAAVNLTYVLAMAGRFEEAILIVREVLESGAEGASWAPSLRVMGASLEALRGNAEQAREHLDLARDMSEGSDVQSLAVYAATESGVAWAERNYGLALGAGERALDVCLDRGFSPSHQAVRMAFPHAVDAAIALHRPQAIDELTERLANHPPGEIPPFLHTHIVRARALATAARGSEAGVEEGLIAMRDSFRELGYPFWTASAELDLAEWLSAQGRAADAAEHARAAATTFDRLGVQPLLARARQLLTSDHLAAVGEM